MDEKEPELSDEEIEKCAEAELEQLRKGIEKEETAPEIYCGLWSVN